MRKSVEAAVLITNDKVVTNNTNNTVNITKDKVEDYETIKSKLTIESKKRKSSQDSSSESVNLKKKKEDTGGEKKKILKTRKIKKTKTYIGEKVTLTLSMGK
jgi:hypothetical protein